MNEFLMQRGDRVRVMDGGDPWYGEQGRAVAKNGGPGDERWWVKLENGAGRWINEWALSIVYRPGAYNMRLPEPHLVAEFHADDGKVWQAVSDVAPETKPDDLRKNLMPPTKPQVQEVDLALLSDHELDVLLTILHRQLCLLGWHYPDPDRAGLTFHTPKQAQAIIANEQRVRDLLDFDWAAALDRERKLDEQVRAMRAFIRRNALASDDPEIQRVAKNLVNGGIITSAGQLADFEEAAGRHQEDHIRRIMEAEARLFAFFERWYENRAKLNRVYRVRITSEADCRNPGREIPPAKLIWAVMRDWKRETEQGGAF